MRTVVITGAASGIGAATAARLRAAGVPVRGIDLHGSDIDADLSTPEGRSFAVDACEGPIDGVVCCAGLGPLSGHPADRLVSVNYFGAVDVVNGLRPLLTQGASVVAVSSSSTSTQPLIPADVVAACLAGDEAAARTAAVAASALAAYPASKLALAHWVRANAVTWIKTCVRVNAVAPGMIDTPMTFGPDVDPELAKALSHYPIPMGRPGRADEVAAVIEFLLSDASSLLCGSVVYADGGTDALMRGPDWPAPWAPTSEQLAQLFA